ncbi:hypothetical protein HDA40_003439 [Hamadaea flava]|uniref:Uncharacterized protein n=1 Tax=Hamadaea flava TaxID=1742688 RepID=A0ABV8LK78_9ACTN|nr:hypothetical protein [Hamadaea flava]MCP2324932.1 hypothetical protein [Hamadaea flava]
MGTIGQVMTQLAPWAALIVSGFIARSAVVQAKLARNQKQPYVYVDIRPDEHQPALTVLLVRNQGPTVAKNVRVTLSPPLVSALHNAPENIETWEIGAIPPGAHLVRGIGVGNEILDRNPKPIQITIEADGPRGPVDPSVYGIDIKALEGVLIGHRTLNDVAVALKEIATTFAEVTTKSGGNGAFRIESRTQAPPPTPAQRRGDGAG